MRKIHEDIRDAFYAIADGECDRVKVAPKVEVKRLEKPYLVGLFYYGRLCAVRNADDPIYGEIYTNHPQWDSQTALGYYRAFFGADIRKKCGEVILRDEIELVS